MASRRTVAVALLVGLTSVVVPAVVLATTAGQPASCAPGPATVRPVLTDDPAARPPGAAYHLTSSTAGAAKGQLSLLTPATTSKTIILSAQGNGCYRGAVTLLVQDTGPSEQVDLTVFGDPTASSNGNPDISPRSAQVNGGAVTGIRVEVGVAGTAATNLTVVGRVPAATATGTATVLTLTMKLAREPTLWDLILPILLGIVFALAFFVIRGTAWLAWVMRRPTYEAARDAAKAAREPGAAGPPGGRPAAWALQRVAGYVAPADPHPAADALHPRWVWAGLGPYRRRRVFPPASWSFGGSWVTLIAVFGAVLGTILSATGVTATAFPGIDLSPFVVLNLALGAVAAFGPLVYAICSKIDVSGPATRPTTAIRGTAIGLFLAGTSALVGIAGQLVGLAVLITLSNSTAAERGWMVAGIALAANALFWYSFTSLDQLVHTGPTSQAGAGLVSGV